MKKLILFIIGAVCVLSSCNGQPSSEKTTEVPLTEITPLKIGDKVPDIVFHHMLNYKDATARLSDFRGKLVILDFWATWCSSCIAGFPKLARLQQEYGNKLQIFLINAKNTGDDENKITTFFNHRTLPGGKRYNLPIVMYDTLLDQLFSHQMIPHYVWINTDGCLIGSTASDQVNEKNMLTLFKTGKVQLRLKNDVMGFDRHQPLFFNKKISVHKGDLSYYTIISRHIKGIPSGVFSNHNSDKQFTRFCVSNLPAKRLYQIAFQVTWPDNRTICDVAPSSEFEYKGHGDYESWFLDHSYCYESVFPPQNKEKILASMRQELFNYFGYQGAIAYRTITCLVIKSVPGKEKPLSKGGRPGNNLGAESTLHYIRNQPISRLTGYLDRNMRIPVVNETHFSKSLDMTLPRKILDTVALEEVLHRYGFKAEKEQRKMQVFVISDKRERVSEQNTKMP